MPEAPTSAARVLVVDDEPAVRTSLTRALNLEEFEADAVPDGFQGLERVAAGTTDVLVLDVTMPVLDGLETCRRLRSTGNRIPVLMLTARDAVEDRVAGLEAGADDYLVKPFALQELIARLRALLRRIDVAPAAGPLTFDDLGLDPARHEAYRGNRRIPLTKTEFLLLRCFLERPGEVLSRTQLFEAVWGYDFGATSNSLGVYMGYLRRKTEEAGEPRLLHNVRGVGYVLRSEP